MRVQASYFYWRCPPFDIDEREGSGDHEGAVTTTGDAWNAGRRVYVFTENVPFAMRVALGTGRPPLLRSPSGWSKSSLSGGHRELHPSGVPAVSGVPLPPGVERWRCPTHLR